MKILLNLVDLNKATLKVNDLGFVPTMGALHKGHFSLIRESKKKCKKTLVSIFVNPNQFNDKQDFFNYPRNIKNDLSLLKKLKIDYVFTPSVGDIYRSKRLKKITLKKNDKILCAKSRKGHFEGVLDVMDRLIHLIRPKKIFMGEKDFQQIYLIKKFIKNKYNSKIIGCPTIRNKQKAALSSRNFLLDKKSLSKVELIAKDLIYFKKNTLAKSKNRFELLDSKRKLLKENFKIKIEYFELRNSTNLNLTNKIKNSKLFLAYYIKNIRLIDNF
jgi:pantoate--beta-alanine ligase